LGNQQSLAGLQRGLPRRRLELECHGWYGVPVTDDELDAGAPLAIAVLTERLARAG